MTKRFSLSSLPLYLPPLLLTAFLSVTTLFTSWPEMAAYPFFLLHGLLPYRDYSQVHTPLLEYLLAFLYSIFGFQSWVPHLLGTCLLLSTIALLVFLINHHVKNNLFTIISCLLAGYIIIALEGNHLWAESLVTPLFLLIFSLQLSALTKPAVKQFVLIGLLFGLTLLTKQTSLYGILPLSFFFLILKSRPKTSWSKLSTYFLSTFLPLLLVLFLFLLFLFYFHIFSDFLFWAVKFPAVLPTMTGPNLTPDLLLPTLRQLLAVLLFIVLAAVTTIRAKKAEVTLAFVWLVSVYFFAFPRFGYFHLEPMLAFFILIIGLGWGRDKLAMPALFLILLLVLPVTTKIFRQHLNEGQAYWDNNTVTISTWLKNNFPHSTVYALNTSDLIYPLSGKIPTVLPWVDQLSWNMAYLGATLSQTFIANPPDLIVFSPYPPNSYQPTGVVSYFYSHYHLIARFPPNLEVWEKN